METHTHRRQLYWKFLRNAQAPKPCTPEGWPWRGTWLRIFARVQKALQAQEETENQFSLSLSSSISPPPPSLCFYLPCMATDTTFLPLPAEDIAMCAESLSKSEFAFSDWNVHLSNNEEHLSKLQNMRKSACSASEDEAGSWKTTLRCFFELGCMNLSHGPLSWENLCDLILGTPSKPLCCHQSYS